MNETKKKTYEVTLPVTGIVCVEVEAESEEAAIEAALNHEDITTDNLVEWNTCEKIVRGNVFYGMQNEAEARELS